MCNVCGCGDSQIEQVNSDHHHDHPHDHHGHHHEQPHSHSHAAAHQENPQPVIVHHHYHHQGDVHHHHYHYPSSQHQSHHQSQQQHTHSHDQHHAHPHDHSHGHSHSHSETHSHEEHHDHNHAHELTPEQSAHGDLHYGKGEAETHVAGVSQRKLIEIEMDVLSKNNHLASHDREHFNQANQLVLNLVSSPGSGKTTLLTETLKRIQQSDRACAVIEGDQQTTNDADRIRETGVDAIQVNTGKGCHLDAKMVHDACHQLGLEQDGLLFIENVGNLVCPASFDLGEKYKVAILSVTEGEDKPLKYPNMFAASQLMIINKIDLLPYVAFDVEACIENARKVNPYIQVLKLSATTGEGMEAWLDWLNNA